ncbi:MAG: hypothetical protein ACQEUD_13460 [Bacillota bacterium]|uniref:hypothetical protein n=2 Tax=Bacillus infantis TaxID=324767 RepID=UPI0039826E1C
MKHFQLFHRIDDEVIVMSRYTIVFIAALAAEALAAWGVAAYFSVRFIEVLFFIGAAFAAVTFIFSTSGGSPQRHINSMVGAQTGIIQKDEPFFFRKGPVFFASLVLAVIGLIFFVLLIAGIIPPA